MKILKIRFKMLIMIIIQRLINLFQIFLVQRNKYQLQLTLL